MAINKLAEYKAIQDKIVQQLFDKATKVSEADIQKLIGKESSETEYHLEQLVAGKRIQLSNITSTGRSITAYIITAEGRKWVMEK